MKKVLIVFDTSRLTGRDLLRGAEAYFSTFAQWEVYTLDPNYLSGDFANELEQLDLETFDGFLGHTRTREFICCTENISTVLKDQKTDLYKPKEKTAGTSPITTNSSQIGETAADYFISRGFKNYAYCGFINLPWSDRRYKSYSEALSQKGFNDIQYYMHRPSRDKVSDQKNMAEWLKNLPKPIAIFACNDDRAVYVLEACKSSNINVPEEVAVLGVDNDDLICNLSSPPLSSIALNFKNAGFQAAKHLDELMMKTAENTTIDVLAVEIFTRKSTDIVAIEDPELASAIVFIRAHFQEPIQVTDVVDATTISRRELEYRFKFEFKKTVQEEINRLRIELIKKMLMTSREPVYHIANQLKFTDPEHFSRYFKNLTGVSPSVFRRSSVNAAIMRQEPFVKL